MLSCCCLLACLLTCLLSPACPRTSCLQTAPKYDVLFMDFGNKEHVVAAQVINSCSDGALDVGWELLS
jgi:hypothetical protein